MGFSVLYLSIDISTFLELIPYRNGVIFTCQATMHLLLVVAHLYILIGGQLRLVSYLVVSQMVTLSLVVCNSGV